VILMSRYFYVCLASAERYRLGITLDQEIITDIRGTEILQK
jgi:hypothetical protein